LNSQTTDPTLSTKPIDNQMASKVARKIAQSVLSREQAEGAGARVRRSIGTRSLRNLDPFLMLDEFSVVAPAGFPE
jgi:quercetin 2,3-dioxygenase